MEIRHPQPAAAPAVSAELVGRVRERALLGNALAAAGGGRGGMVFLAGEAGIGKSRLARALADDAAAAGFAVLWGRAVQAEIPAAYRPLAEALSAAVRDGTGPDKETLGPFRDTLGRLVPEWRPNSPVAFDDSLLAVAEAVLRFLVAGARGRGALLVLDDLHWADPETITIVEYLADNLVSSHVLCVATLRDDGRSPGLDLARALHGRRVASLVVVPPLEAGDVSALVASCLRTDVAPPEAVSLAARADGVPFMVEELLAAAISSGALGVEGGRWRAAGSLHDVVPATLGENVRRRVAQLGDACRAVVVAAAVLGRRFDADLLPAITGLDGEDVLGALHEAVDAQLVAFDRADATFRFRHALTRDSVFAELFPPEVRALSRRALDAVQAAHPSLEGSWAELAAELAASAGDSVRAAELLLEVARRAVERGALASAEATLDRARGAFSVPEALGLEIDEVLLHVLSLAGKRQRAVDVGSALLERLGNGATSARRRIDILLRLARVAVAAARWDEADELLAQAGEAPVAGTADDLAARLEAIRAQALVTRDPPRAAAFARRALEAAERLGLAEVACEALEVLGRAQRVSDIEAAEAAFARALELAESQGLTVWRARALQELGAIDMLRGRPLGRLEQARELALGHGALATAAVVDVQLAAALVLGDDPHAGEVAAERSVELCRRYHLDVTRAAALGLEAYAHARARRPVEVQNCVDEALRLAPGAADIEVKVETAMALLALVEEDRLAARRHLCAGVASAAGAGLDYSVFPGTGLLALLRALDHEGDSEDVVLPGESVHFATHAFLRYSDAILAGRAGAATRATDLVAEADACLGEHHLWLRSLARRLVAEAAIDDGWGTPAAWLGQAVAAFDAGRYDTLASACRALLRRAGSPVPRQRAGTGVPTDLRALGITAREVEVLRLLGTGLPNKEIAARLFLSPRTVERHVANVSTKVGVSRRSELVAYAARTLRDTTES